MCCVGEFVATWRYDPYGLKLLMDYKVLHLAKGAADFGSWYVANPTA